MVGTLLAAAAAISSSGDALAGEGTVLILSNAALAADDKRLLEALHIYTRDLGSRVVIAGNAPAVVETSGLDQIARQARKESADIVVWTSRRSDGAPVFYVLSVRDLDLRETDIAALGVERAAEAVALKVRTLLSRPVPRSPASEAPPADASPGARGRDSEPRASDPATGTAGAAAGGAPGEHSRSGTLTSPTPRSPEPEIARPGPAFGAAAEDARLPQPRPWVALAIAHTVALPFDRTWVRQGVALSAEVRLGDGPLVARLDGAFTRASELTGTSFKATLGDIPLGAALLLRWRSGAFSVAAGPRATVHFLQVQSTFVDGRTGSVRERSGGAGALAQAEVEWRGRIRFFAGVSCEAVLPARTFTVDNSPAVRTGAAQVGTLLGLAILIP